VQQPIVTGVNLVGSSGSYTATITGQNFSASALVTLWDQGQCFLMTLPASSATIISSTQIAQLSSLPVSTPNELVLKVRNPQGPRSSGMPLSVSVSTFSEPLILNGQGAPGGGAFAGFAGFWSLNNRGEAVFNAGVDTNADGIPDYFADFEFSASQITKPAVAGFTAISSANTHIRLNNRGDMAFGDVNGLYGGFRRVSMSYRRVARVQRPLSSGVRRAHPPVQDLPHPPYTSLSGHSRSTTQGMSPLLQVC